MKSNESREYKHIQRKVRAASNKAAREFQSSLYEKEKEDRIKEALQERIQKEKRRKILAGFKDKEPLKYKAMKNLYRLWDGKGAKFVGHLISSYKNKEVCPAKESPKKDLDTKCALTGVKKNLLTGNNTNTVVCQEALECIIDFAKDHKPKNKGNKPVDKK